MRTIASYFSLIKFSHTIFALPFAFVGFFVALVQTDYSFDTGVFVLIVLCMVFARSAAMAFNRYLDAEFDSKNARTVMREIPSGVISPRAALIFTLVTSLLFIATSWFINEICFYLSPVALCVILMYSYTKRFTALCHFVLGLGLSLAPIGAYLAVTGFFALLPLVFSAIVFTWTGGFDIIYALQDEEFDADAGLHSIPSKLGAKRALAVSSAVHIVTALFVIIAGLLGDFSFVYWIGAGAFIGLLVFQHSLVTPKDLSKITLAFGTSNGIAGVVFSACTILSLYI